MKRLLLIVLAIISFVFGGNTRIFAQADDCYQKEGTWYPEHQKCYTHMGVMVSVEYPLELVGTGSPEQLVDDFISQVRLDFLQSYTPDPQLSLYDNNWTMDITYERFQFSENVQTFKFDILYFIGGVHSNLDIKTFTFDMAQQKELSLTDIFQAGINPWPTLATLVEQDLTELFKAGTNASILDWIRTGTGEKPENYKYFALTSDSLMFFFPPYQVASYNAGPITVEIPLTAIRTLLKPEFAP